MPSLAFAPARVLVDRLDDGALVLRSPLPLLPIERAVGAWLTAWAEKAPKRAFLAERSDAGEARSLTYAEVLSQVRGIGEGLLQLGLGPARPLLLLSDNSIDHALMQLGAMHAGIPAAPISPAYALVSRDHAKLRAIAEQVGAGAVFAERQAPFASALAALGSALPLITSEPSQTAVATVEELAVVRPGAALDAAFAALGPETIAKILFTSGSTGTPKGVVNTHRMLCANQQAIAQLWPFLAETPPVVVDWLPWSHTFGGNHNFNLVLRNGGTLHIDRGKPAPGLFERSIASLREVSPTLYFNVPRGFDMLIARLEADQELRARFFAKLQVIFYAAAALPQPLWRKLEQLAERAGGPMPAMTSAWGSTETAPMATMVHYPSSHAGIIGLPGPGTALKLAPVADKLELRVQGPNVTPGYWQRGGQIAPALLDADGFLPTGDAGRLEDEQAPEKGVLFDGRIAENFKLSSGTWVSVGQLRTGLVGALGALVTDVVIAGHDRDHIALLLFANTAGCRQLCPEASSLDDTQLVAHPLVRALIAKRLATWNQDHPGTSTRVARAVLLSEPPSIDGGEITDKGYINQRAVLTRRSAQVEGLFSPGSDKAHIEPRDDDPT